VASGAASTLTWSSTNATTCTASSGWSGTKATSGSQSTGALTASGNYTLTCTGAGGSASRSTTVTVAGTPPPPPPPQPSQVPPAPPPLTQLPAWVTALAIGQWGQIPNTALSSVDPSPMPAGNFSPTNAAAKVGAWTSFVVDTRTSKVYSVANGGHNDYSGNEVDELNLELDQPAWTQRLAPTPSGSLSNCQSYYADNRPASRHSYYGVTLDIVNDRIMLFGGAHWCVGGGFHSAVSSYNIGSNTYNGPGTHPNVPGTADVSAYSIDPSTGDVYGVVFSAMRRWNRATNTWTILNPSGTSPNGVETMSAMDTTRRRILFVGGTSGDNHVYTLQGNTVMAITLTGPNAASIANAVKGSLVYVEAFDRYLVRLGAAGATVYMIDPQTFEVTTLGTTGGGTIPLTQNGPYNKFLYVPRLGGAVYVPSHTGNAWFLRLH
jgi:hypothetical protein